MSLPGRCLDLFYFSIETLATVGYGDMHPQTNYGHLIATIEIFTGMSFLAVMTGLIFARFSRPRARFVFADYPVVTPHQGPADPDDAGRQRTQQHDLAGHCTAVADSPGIYRGGPSAAAIPRIEARTPGTSDVRAELDAVAQDRRRTARCSASRPRSSTRPTPLPGGQYQRRRRQLGTAVSTPAGFITTPTFDGSIATRT